MGDHSNAGDTSPAPCDPESIANATPKQLETAAKEYWDYWHSGAAAKARFEKAYRENTRSAQAAEMDPWQGLKEFNNPGSTAVGRLIDVLVPWGAPTKTAQLGNVVIYTWTFLEDSASSGTSYSGTVTPQGNISL